MTDHPGTHDYPRIRVSAVPTTATPIGPVASGDVLRLIRESRGLLLKDVADRLGKSDAYVSKAESGFSTVTGLALEAFARVLDVQQAMLVRPMQIQPMEGAHFRSHATTSMRSRKQALADVNWAAEAINRALSLTELDFARPVPVLDGDVLDGGGEEAASIVRKFWRITGPIPDMTELLESAGVFVLDYDFGHNHIDAITVHTPGPATAVTLIRSTLPADRRRLTLAHELGHLVLDRQSLGSAREIEDRATAFAGEFLAPMTEIADLLEGVTPSSLDLLQSLRMRWGVSVASLIRRARLHELISEMQYRYWFQVLNSPRNKTHMGGGLVPEQGRMTAALLGALADSDYSLSEIVEATGTGISDLYRFFADGWPWASPTVSLAIVN